MTRQKIISDKELNSHDRVHGHLRKQTLLWFGTVLLIGILGFVLYPFFTRICLDITFREIVTNNIAHQSGTIIVAAVSIFVALIGRKA